VSHLGTLYPIGCCAALLQPGWWQAWRSGDTVAGVLLALFWVGFVVTLALYTFVCRADTRYCEASKTDKGDYESRKCEECSASITCLRVKHCQTCGKCTADFDHHCRYLNVCVGGRTYPAWLAFVAGLLALMAACSYAATCALVEPWRCTVISVSSSGAPALYALLGLQAFLASTAGLFLLCLLAQHIYFMYEGITTLEYIKDQAPGFPALPPKGWRQAVRGGECYGCADALELMEVDDQSEVWFCTICQADVGKAGIEFFTCENCENVNVCPLCRNAAEQADAPIVTYRVSSLRRRVEALDSAGQCGHAAVRAPSYASVGATPRVGSFNSQREPRVRRRSLTAVVADVEGHSGDAKVQRKSCCGTSSSGAGDGGDDAESGGEVGDSSTDDESGGL